MSGSYRIVKLVTKGMLDWGELAHVTDEAPAGVVPCIRTHDAHCCGGSGSIPTRCPDNRPGCCVAHFITCPGRWVPWEEA